MVPVSELRRDERFVALSKTYRKLVNRADRLAPCALFDTPRKKYFVLALARVSNQIERARESLLTHLCSLRVSRRRRLQTR